MQSRIVERRVVSHEGRMLTILVDLPADYDSTRAYPLLVILHGNGGTAESLLSEFRTYPMRDVIIAAPEGQYLKRVGEATGYSWFLETADRKLWEEADRQSVGRVLTTINQISSLHRVEGVAVFGFSQGAALAYMAGLASPSTIGRIAAVGGVLPVIAREGSVLSMAQVERAKHVRLFIARGIDDRSIARKEYERQVSFFTEQGYDVAALQYDGGHRLTGDLFERLLSWLSD